MARESSLRRKRPWDARQERQLQSSPTPLGSMLCQILPQACVSNGNSSAPASDTTTSSTDLRCILIPEVCVDGLFPTMSDDGNISDTNDSWSAQTKENKTNSILTSTIEKSNATTLEMTNTAGDRNESSILVEDDPLLQEILNNPRICLIIPELCFNGTLIENVTDRFTTTVPTQSLAPSLTPSPSISQIPTTSFPTGPSMSMTPSETFHPTMSKTPSGSSLPSRSAAPSSSFPSTIPSSTPYSCPTWETILPSTTLEFTYTVQVTSLAATFVPGMESLVLDTLAKKLLDCKSLFRLAYSDPSSDITACEPSLPEAKSCWTINSVINIWTTRRADSRKKVKDAIRYEFDFGTDINRVIPNQVAINLELTEPPQVEQKAISAGGAFGIAFAIFLIILVVGAIIKVQRWRFFNGHMLILAKRVSDRRSKKEGFFPSSRGVGVGYSEDEDEDELSDDDDSDGSSASDEESERKAFSPTAPFPLSLNPSPKMGYQNSTTQKLPAKSVGPNNHPQIGDKTLANKTGISECKPEVVLPRQTVNLLEQPMFTTSTESWGQESTKNDSSSTTLPSPPPLCIQSGETLVQSWKQYSTEEQQSTANAPTADHCGIGFQDEFSIGSSEESTTEGHSSIHIAAPAAVPPLRLLTRVDAQFSSSRMTNSSRSVLPSQTYVEHDKDNESRVGLVPNSDNDT